MCHHRQRLLDLLHLKVEEVEEAEVKWLRDDNCCYPNKVTQQHYWSTGQPNIALTLDLKMLFSHRRKSEQRTPETEIHLLQTKDHRPLSRKHSRRNIGICWMLLPFHSTLARIMTTSRLREYADNWEKQQQKTEGTRETMFQYIAVCRRCSHNTYDTHTTVLYSSTRVLQYCISRLAWVVKILLVVFEANVFSIYSIYLHIYIFDTRVSRCEYQVQLEYKYLLVCI